MKMQITTAGKYKITTTDSITGEIKRVSPWIKNLVVTNNQHGLNLICRHLIGDTTYPLEITQAKIGTGITAPAITDTDLETVGASGILRALESVNNNEVTIEFFIPSLQLDDDTYTEFGLFCGNQLFARSLIDPTYTKSSNEDTTIEYIITLEPDITS